MVDDILIGNCFASESELAVLASVDTSRTTMRIELEPDATDIERELVFDRDHANRGDASAYMLALLLGGARVPRPLGGPSRVRQALCHPRRRPRGERQLAHYRGELEVVLQDMENDGTRNLVAGALRGAVPARLHQVAEFPFGFVRP